MYSYYIVRMETKYKPSAPFNQYPNWETLSVPKSWLTWTTSCNDECEGGTLLELKKYRADYWNSIRRDEFHKKWDWERRQKELTESIRQLEEEKRQKELTLAANTLLSLSSNINVIPLRRSERIAKKTVKEQ